MIFVRAKLESSIDSSRDDQLCVVTIANDGTGDKARGNYKVCLYSRGRNPRLIRSALIEDWPREREPAWRLIQKAFEVLG